jgi:hypothetical protein
MLTVTIRNGHSRPDRKLAESAVAPLVEAGNVYLPIHAGCEEDFLLETASVQASFTAGRPDRRYGDGAESA